MIEGTDEEINFKAVTFEALVIKYTTRAEHYRNKIETSSEEKNDNGDMAALYGEMKLLIKFTKMLALEVNCVVDFGR